MENCEHSYLLKNERREEKPPRDKRRFVYVVFYFAGLTFSFPYSMMITMTDFWKYKFRNTSIPSSSVSRQSELNFYQKTFPGYLSITGNVPMMIVVFLCSIIGYRLNIKTRLLTSGIIMILIFGINTTLAGLDSDGWQNPLFYLVLIINIMFTVSGAIFQGSFLGNLGRFPPRYIGCTYDGMGLGAVLPVLINIIVVLSDHNVVSAGLTRLSLALLVMVVLMVLYYPACQTPFYVYYSGLKERNNSDSTDTIFVLRKTWVYISVLLFTFVTNITIHPAVTALVKPVSKVPSLWNDTLFVPVCCFLCHTVSDWLGKSLATFLQWPGPGRRTEATLLILSMLRFGFLPLLMRCNVAPLNRSTEILFQSDAAFVVFLSLFSILGGYIGNVALMLGPKEVDTNKQEVVGSIQITAQVLGLGIGSLIGPYLVSFL